MTPQKEGQISMHGLIEAALKELHDNRQLLDLDSTVQILEKKNYLKTKKLCHRAL